MEEQEKSNQQSLENNAAQQPAAELPKPWQGGESSPPRPGTPDLESAISQVGEPLEVFRCINLLLLVWAIGGLIALLAGVAMLPLVIWIIVVKQNIRFEMIQALLGPFLAWLGWELIRSSYRRMGSRVLLCERGFIYQHRQGVTVFRWEEIREVLYDDDTAKPGPSGFPRVNMMTEFTVVRTDEVEFRFSLYNLRRHIKLARAIFKATKPLGTMWVSWQERLS